MDNPEKALAPVAQRAYELARSGEHRDFVSIQEAIMREGFAEAVPWLEREGVMASLQAICDVSRKGGSPAQATTR
jgi:hypothetical protein